MNNKSDILKPGTLCATHIWVFVVIGLNEQRRCSTLGIREYICLFNDDVVDNAVIQYYDEGLRLWRFEKTVKCLYVP